MANWADAWLVSFHAGKTFSMIKLRKIEPVMHPPLTMTNTVIFETQTHKHLHFLVNVLGLTMLIIYAGTHGHG